MNNQRVPGEFWDGKSLLFHQVGEGLEGKQPLSRQGGGSNVAEATAQALEVMKAPLDWLSYNQSRVAPCHISIVAPEIYKVMREFGRRRWKSLEKFWVRVKMVVSTLDAALRGQEVSREVGRIVRQFCVEFSRFLQGRKFQVAG